MTSVPASPPHGNGSAAPARQRGGDEIQKITHKDTVEAGQNWVFPPKPGQLFGGPGAFINIL